MDHGVMQFFNKGMRLDLSPSASSMEYSYENKNIRITARDEDTLFSATNERGPFRLPLNDTFSGVVIGVCVVGEKYVVFSTDEDERIDYIYICDILDYQVQTRVLYSGNLNFNKENKIDSLFVYENENIQKVYWIDGINLARFINIASSLTVMDKWNDNSFDFTPVLNMQNTTMDIDAIGPTSSDFKSGVIQYGISYFNKNGLLSNIFEVSKLNYILNNLSGGVVDENINIAFKITIKNPDLNFQYLRIYSIYRSSIDATPVTKVVTDVKIGVDQTIVYIDKNNTGYDIDPSQLFFIGGDKIVPYTMDQKDNTLFVGNYSLDSKSISQFLKDQIKLLPLSGYSDRLFLGEKDGFYKYENQSFYQYDKMKTFYPGQMYRLGIVGVDNTGKYSDVMFVRDFKTDKYPLQEGEYVDVEKFRLTIDSDLVILELLDNGFVLVMPVIVYPEKSDLNVLAAGMLSPTVYLLKERSDKSLGTIDIYSSWFARSIPPNDLVQYIGYGYNTLFKHDYPLYSNIKPGGELLNATNNNHVIPSNKSLAYRDAIIKDNGHLFYVDQSVLTLNSPDLDLDDNSSNINFDIYKLRISGVIPLDSSASDMSVLIDGEKTISTANGFYKPYVGLELQENIDNRYAFNLVSANTWIDGVHNPKSGFESRLLAFTVYPWHRNGSLSNGSGSDIKAKLKEKKLSNTRFSYNTLFASVPETYSYIGDILYIDSEEELVYRVRLNGLDLLYKANVDKICTTEINYPISISDDDKVIVNTYEELARAGFRLIPSSITDTNKSKDPISLKYKSNKHTVITLDAPDFFVYTQSVLPSVNGLLQNVCDQYDSRYVNRVFNDQIPQSVSDAKFITYYCNSLPSISDVKDGDTAYLTTDGRVYTAFIEDEIFGQWEISSNFLQNDTYYTALNDLTYAPYIKNKTSLLYCRTIEEQLFPLFDSIYQGQITIPNTNIDKPYLFYGELYSDNIINQFGGSTDDALALNIWLKCGDRVNITGVGMTVDYQVGDTYYQRYDALKTYPFTLSDQNSVVDIVSFMCLSRINLDGRTDKNRGLKSNIAAQPDKFNLMNLVYSQNDNFFQYQHLDAEEFSLNKFKSDVLWSTTKTFGETIDSWTNINTINSMHMDGDKGDVLKIIRFNNEIFCVQEKGLSTILFNSRILIPASDNIPIEISNSQKVDGKVYLSNIVGTDNKDSVCIGSNGIYFTDSRTNGIYNFNGEQLVSISNLKMLRQWVNNNLNKNNKVRTFYDCNNDDIYFINKDTALCYSEYLGEFTSFMSYEKADYLFNLGDDFIAINNGSSWAMFKGDYNIYFDEYKPFSMVFIANQEPTVDKVFDIFEYYADFYDSEYELIHNKTFSNFEIWNEYQYGETRINYNLNINAVKRFRSWGLTIPRDSKNGSDRIRNHWSFFKITNNDNNIYKMKFNNALIKYSK